MEWLKTRMRPSAGWTQWFLIFAIGIAFSIFSGITTLSTTVYAAEASWNDDSLTVDGKTFKAVNSSSRKKALGRDTKDIVYENTQDGTVSVIYFPADTNIRTAESATYATYKTEAGKLKEVSSEEITVKQPNQSELEDLDCDVRGGTGWWICPISNGISWGIDQVYSWISDLMQTPALKTDDSDSGIRVAWGIMRNIANAAFILAFLIIIYSQLSNIGISNYGIKRLVPRVVVAAIMVNVSFILCALAIDLSNISGLAMQEAFNEIRTQVSANGSFNDVTVPTWSDMTAFVLAGGAGTIGAFNATGGALGSAAYFILPILASVLLTAVVVFIILAARQAMIIILTVISPLAFVCYLLPGTEKFFEKWRSTFFTLLIFFPAFSVVFGGAQLAGMIILQSADSWIMVLLSLTVQLAVLAIAPLIFRLSGGILSRFAGIVNDRNRGIIDRTRNWSHDRAKMMANKRSFSKKDGELKPYNFMRRAGRRLHYHQQTMKNRAEDWQKRADAAHKASRVNALADMERRGANQSSELAEAITANRYNSLKSMGAGAEPNIKFRKFSRDKAHYQDIMDESWENDRNLAIQGFQRESIQRAVDHKLATSMQNSEEMRMQAGEVENMYFGNQRGSYRAWASARTTLTKANEESIKNASSILNAMNVNNNDMVDLANGVSRRNLTVTDDIRTAAIRHVLGGKDTLAINNLLDKTDFSQLSDEIAQEYGDALLTNSAKPVWVGGAAAASIKDNNVNLNGPEYTRQLVRDAINANAISAEAITTTDLPYLKTIKELLSDADFTQQINPNSIKKLQENINLAQTDPRYSGRIGKTSKLIQEIADTIR